jgi:hypothetical protein
MYDICVEMRMKYCDGSVVHRRPLGRRTQGGEESLLYLYNLEQCARVTYGKTEKRSYESPFLL